MPTINEFSEERRDKLIKYYADHADTLRKQQIAAANEAQNFLWATSAGAAVALMAFMGAKDVVRESAAAWTSLIAFFEWIVALTALRAVNYLTMLRSFTGWIRITTQAAAGKIDVDAPRDWVNAESHKRLWVPQLLGYVALGASSQAAFRRPLICLNWHRSKQQQRPLRQ